jgi:hypothetical protein
MDKPTPPKKVVHELKANDLLHVSPVFATPALEEIPELIALQLKVCRELGITRGARPGKKIIEAALRKPRLSNGEHLSERMAYCLATACRSVIQMRRGPR